MVVDIHALLEKNLIIKKVLQPKFGYKYLGPFNPSEKQMLYDKQTGEIYKYYDKPKNILDKIASRHDVCYELKPKSKGLCDRIMVKEFDNIPYKDRPYGTALIRSIINTKQKLGMGNITMNESVAVENHNKILSEELHKPKRKNYLRRKIIVNHINEIVAADLVEMQKFARLNKGYRYSLTYIDIFSKFAWVIPLKDKKGINAKNALEKIFKQRKCEYLWTDKGKEFYNKQVQDLLKENNIKLYSTYNFEIKSSVTERFNRTFKNMMFKKFTENDNTIFYNILDELVDKYNDKYHRTIKMTPIQASKKINEKKIRNIYNFENTTNKIGKFKIGDRVRISLEKNIFEKSYETNWTEEIFIIYDIKYSNVPFYYLKHLNGEKMEGSVYAQEL